MGDTLTPADPHLRERLRTIFMRRSGVVCGRLDAFATADPQERTLTLIAVSPDAGSWARRCRPLVWATS